jgi:sortase A
MLYLWASRVCRVVGILLIVAGVAYGGLIGYLAWQESSSPSTSRILILRDGRQIPLTQPTHQIKPPAESSSAAEPTQTGGTTPPQSSSTDTSPVQNKPAASDPVEVLPPLHVTIPGISVDWPVVLADNDHMPRFKGVGWMLGTAYPGEQGNMVLFGHLDGAYSTFGRLKELKPGDTFTVTTDSGSFTYLVRTTFETTPDDVSVLAPTNNATATLITCSGHWDALAQNYSNRLIVKADYISP